MAAPPVAQIDGLGLAENGPNHTPLEGVTEERSTRTFKRTFQHYITNAGTSGAEIVYNRGTGMARNFEQGWYHIPYTNPKATMTSADIDSTIASAKNWEIIEQGFSIKKVSITQIGAQLRPDGANLTSSFVNNPNVMIWRDSDNDMFASCFAAQNINPDENEPIWTLPGGPNGQNGIPFLRPFLPAAALSGDGNSTLREVSFGFMRNADGQPQQPLGQFDLLNGGHMDLIGTGGTYDYHWKPLKRILFNGGGTVPTPIADTTFLVVQNATEVTENVTHMPKLHCIRVPPSWDGFGNVLYNVEIWIEYTFTIAFTRGRYLYSLVLNTNPINPIMLGQLMVNTNYWPQSQRRTYRIATEIQNRRRGPLPNTRRLPNVRLPNVRR